MDVVKRINEIISHTKGLKKKDVIEQVIKSYEADTGITISPKTLYAKLGKTRGLEPELIPYFAKALGVAEQDLFAPEKKEKIAIEEFMKNPAKYQQYIEDKYDKLPPAIKEIVENLLYLGPEEIDLYYAEIKAKALRKKEIEKDVQIGKN